VNVSVKKAQIIVNEVYTRYGIDLVGFQTDEITHLKDQLEDLIDQEVDMDELATPEDCEVDLDELEEEDE
jgi:membrane protease subunit (stomatin/prohibitin family)